MIEIDSNKDSLNIIVILGSLDLQMEDGSSFPLISKSKNQLDERVFTMKGLYEAMIIKLSKNGRR